MLLEIKLLVLKNNTKSSDNVTSLAKFKISCMLVKKSSVPASDSGREVYAFSLQLAISFLIVSIKISIKKRYSGAGTTDRELHTRL